MGRTIDLVLRLLYITAAPFMLAPLATVLPITGTLVGAGIAMVVTLIGGERWHHSVDRIPVLGRMLGGMARVSEYYAEHPPKPLVFYILYPLLLPLILAKPLWRKELVLYRKFNAIALVVVVVGGAWDYFRHWQPEIGFGPFVGAMIGGFVIQFFAMFAIAMPIVTTIVILRQRGLHKTLVGAVALIVVPGVAGGVFAHHNKNAVQFSTFERVDYRTKAGMAELEECIAASPTHDMPGCTRQNRVLHALARAIDTADTTLLGDPTAFDIAEERAREQIATFYKPDEAAAFRLYKDDDLTMVYVKKRGKRYVFLGYAHAAKKLIVKPEELPAAARKKAGF